MTRPLQPPAPAQIGAYLASRGWNLADRAGVTAKWTLATAERQRTVVLITNPDDPEYSDFFAILLARLRDIEERDPSTILADLADAGRDSLVVSVAAPMIATGEIPLAYGQELFGGVRDLIAAGGRSVAITRANFLGPTPPDVMEILDRLTFGETRAGSYILTVKTPVDQQLTLEPSAAHIAFERKALARTVEAVSAACSAAKLDDEDALDEAIEHGLSAQLCRALGRMDPETTGVTVKLDARWAPGLPMPEAPDSVELRSDDLARIEVLGTALAQLVPERDFFLLGWIKTITYDELFESHGVVVVEGRVKNRRRDIRLELEGDALQEAKRLHGEGYITARGTLEKAGRAWVLTNPSEIAFGEGKPPLQGS